MLIGITGAPSKGKSTFFSAITKIDVPISPRPFTTIEPNKGATFITAKCPDKQFGLRCNPKNSKCIDGTRYVPINVVDLAGLVPGAHEGKGLGNKFLDSVRNADMLIQIVDVSGQTDLEGNPTEGADPAEEIRFLETEINEWIASILLKNWNKVKNRNLETIRQILTGLNVSADMIERVADELALSKERIQWSDSEIKEFAKKIRERTLPIVVAANKIDLPGAKVKFEKLLKEFPDRKIFSVYADGELALRKASEKGLIKFNPDSSDFEILSQNISQGQHSALEKISKVLKENGGSGVQKLLNTAVFDVLQLITVYPVSDEHKLTDNFGNVLPDAIFVRKGTTALAFAEKIHTELAKSFLYAIDAKKKIRMAKDHELNDGDVIRIVSAAK